MVEDEMNEPDINLDNLTKEELHRELEKALGELVELDELEKAIVGQTNIHMGMRKILEYRQEFELDRGRLNQRIAQIRSRLDSLDFPSDAT